MSNILKVANNYLFDKYELPFSFIKAPSSGEYKIAATLTALVRESNDFLKKRRSRCTPTLEKFDKKAQRFYFHVVCTEGYSDPSGHDVRIRFKRKETKSGRLEDEIRKMDVRIACSCPSFLYWGAQYFAKRDGYLDGAVRGVYKAPTENDVGKLYVCKHIASVLQLFRKYTIDWEDSKIKNFSGPKEIEESKK